MGVLVGAPRVLTFAIGAAIVRITYGSIMQGLLAFFVGISAYAIACTEEAYVDATVRH